MERIVFLVLLLFTTVQPVISAEVNPTLPPNVPQVVGFDLCNKIYAVSDEKLFTETLSAISANKFTIKEIQSKNGYIIFNCGSKKLLATVAMVDKTHSILKITPRDNNYYFAPVIVTNVFKYLDVYLAKP